LADGLRPLLVSGLNLRLARVRGIFSEDLSNRTRCALASGKIGQILDALRDLSNGPPPTPADPNQTHLEALEPLFADLRRKTSGAAGALQLLESRLAAIIDDVPIAGEAQRKNLLGQVAIETTAMLAEVQRKQGAIGLDVLQRAGKVDHARFRAIVPASDLEHIAVLAAISEARNVDIVFVTLDGGLHGARDAITKAAPRITVTTPPYLRRQIARLRGKH
jgi:hypothetical protein